MSEFSPNNAPFIIIIIIISFTWYQPQPQSPVCLPASSGLPVSQCRSPRCKTKMVLNYKRNGSNNNNNKNNTKTGVKFQKTFSLQFLKFYRTNFHQSTSFTKSRLLLCIYNLQRHINVLKELCDFCKLAKSKKIFKSINNTFRWLLSFLTKTEVDVELKQKYF